MPEINKVSETSDNEEGLLFVTRDYPLGLESIAIPIGAIGLGTIPLSFINPLFSVIPIVIALIVVKLVVTGRRNNQKFQESCSALEDKISNIIKEKYGVELQENPLNVAYGNTYIERGLLSATNPSSERIQVSLEFTDDMKSVHVFSSGVEMPILS